MTVTEVYLAERTQRDCCNLMNEMIDRVTREGKLMTGDVDLYRKAMTMAITIFAMYGHCSKMIMGLEQLKQFQSPLFESDALPVDG